MIVAAAATGDILAAADSPPKKRSLKKGIMYETIRLKGSVHEKFQAVKAAGFEGIEPMGGMNQAEVLKARDDAGLQCASVCCHTHWQKPITDPDPAVREIGLNGLRQSVRDAKAYGASSVLFVPAVVCKQVSYADAYTRSQAEIRKVLPLAEMAGSARVTTLSRSAGIRRPTTPGALESASPPEKLIQAPSCGG